MTNTLNAKRIPSERRLKIENFVSTPLFFTGFFTSMFCAGAWSIFLVGPFLYTTQLYVFLWLSPVAIIMLIAGVKYLSASRRLNDLYRTVNTGKVVGKDDGTGKIGHVYVEGLNEAGQTIRQQKPVTPAHWASARIGDAFPWANEAP